MVVLIAKTSTCGPHAEKAEVHCGDTETTMALARLYSAPDKYRELLIQAIIL